MSENSVTLVGNLTEDPELRYTSQGTAVTNFRIAVNKRIRDAATGEWKDGDASYFRVNVWRDLAEHVADSLRKGTRVIVTGTLKWREWESQEGEKRSAVEIEATECGPSLKWATAQVQRATRGATANTGGSWNGGGGGNGSSWGDDAPIPEEVPF
jgi:single-strand DNA-binding protein